jgi:hypothetical protein
LGGCLGPVQPCQLCAHNPRTAVHLSQVGPQPVGICLVVAVGHHQEDPLTAQVAGQERQQRTGGAVSPVQILHHQGDWRLLGQAPEKAEQQLEQASLGSRTGRPGGGFAEPGEKVG